MLFDPRSRFLPSRAALTSRPLISVVIPTFKRLDILSELLAALRPQLSRTDAEVLVIDNCRDASARDTVRSHAVPKLRYVHEPKSGVVHARNRGVAEARGRYILFIDDDEVPAAGWLDAFAQAAEQGVVAAFGRITARYSTPPAADVRSLLDTMFARDLAAAAGGDITSQYAVLGCGNAMFHRRTCFSDRNCFQTEYNRLGGEDSAFIKRLVLNGARLRYVPDACVEEVVPQDRQTAEYLKTRRYNQGRLRSKVNIEHSLWAGMRWMAVGAAQTVLYTGLWCAARAFRPGKATFYAVQIQGGLGKVLWWRTPASLRTYGA